MKRIRVHGLVAAADRMRRAIASPISPAELERVRRHVVRKIRETDQILAQHGAALRHLSVQSQRAYRYLKSFGLGSLPSAAPQEEEALPTARFPGLRSHFTGLLDELATAKAADLERIGAVIRGSSENIEGVLARDRVEPRQLTAETRAIRGWLAFFAEPDKLAAYAAAVPRARAAFEIELPPSPGVSLPVQVLFRPTSGMFRLRNRKKRWVISLPTPMICFDEGLLAQLAGLAQRRRSGRRAVLEAMERDDYQSIRAEIESLGGVVEQTAGAVHDLADSFARVNTGYFEGASPRPRLAWNDAFTQLKFGHYDFVHDTVMISSTLDLPTIPAFVLDYIVYHELLHKRLGARWRNGRRMVHTPEFKREERRFERAAEAEKLLRKLAGVGQ
jgi:hypothetical protein